MALEAGRAVFEPHPPIKAAAAAAGNKGFSPLKANFKRDIVWTTRPK